MTSHRSLALSTLMMCSLSPSSVPTITSISRKVLSSPLLQGTPTFLHPNHCSWNFSPRATSTLLVTTISRRLENMVLLEKSAMVTTYTGDATRSMQWLLPLAVTLKAQLATGNSPVWFTILLQMILPKWSPREYQRQAAQHWTIALSWTLCSWTTSAISIAWGSMSQ